MQPGYRLKQQAAKVMQMCTPQRVELGSLKSATRGGLACLPSIRNSPHRDSDTQQQGLDHPHSAVFLEASPAGTGPSLHPDTLLLQPHTLLTARQRYAFSSSRYMKARHGRPQKHDVITTGTAMHFRSAHCIFAFVSIYKY